MIIRNSPSGENKDELSSYHRDSPNPHLLKMYFEEHKHPGIQPCHPLLKELIKHAKDKVVLDVGCGMGSVFCQGLLYYDLRPENLYSLDPDPNNFKHDVYPRVHKVVGFVENMDFQADSFDVVHSNEMTLDNLEINYTKALKEICRVLKSGGFYLANEHFDGTAELGKTNPAVSKSSQKLVNIINDEQMLDEIGFKPVIRIKYFDTPSIKPYQFMFYLFQKK